MEQNCGQVFRYAVATGRAERDPTGDLRGALPTAKPKHHASIVDPKGIGQLLRAIDSYEGHFVIKCALRLAPLFFVRPGELRKALWSEIDLDKSEWRIPAERMKMREKHIVPFVASGGRDPARTGTTKPSSASLPTPRSMPSAPPTTLPSTCPSAAG